MKTVPAAKFKAQCLALMDDILETGEPIVVTKRGKPVVRVMPVEQPVQILGRLRGLFEVRGNITDPAIPPEDWDQD